MLATTQDKRYTCGHMHTRNSIAVGILVFSIFLLQITKVQAASYNVSATVPFPAPTQAAVIDTSISGTTTNTQTMNIFGTCEVIAPVTVVSIWRNGISIGSTNCELNGTFQIAVSLSVGANTLIARSSSISNNYGPDSTSAVVNYMLPEVPGPTTPTTSTDNQSTPTSAQTPTAVTSTTLTIAPTSNFALLNERNTVSIEIVVGGGNAPYTVTIQWGDGTVENKVVPAAGTYIFEHTYEKVGTYRALAKVEDVLGATSQYNFLITSESITGPDDVASEPKSISSGSSGSGLSTTWYIALFVLSAIIFTLVGVLVGNYVTRRQSSVANVPTTSRTKKTKPKGTKKVVKNK